MDPCQYCDQPIAAGFDSLCEQHLAMCIPCALHHARGEAHHVNCVQVDCYCLGCQTPATHAQCDDPFYGAYLDDVPTPDTHQQHADWLSAIAGSGATAETLDTHLATSCREV